MPITPPPSGYPLDSSMDNQTVDPRALVPASAGAGMQPDAAQQDAGAMEGLRQMLAVLSGYADNPALSEGARMAQQGIVQMMLALNQGTNQPSQAMMTAA